MWIGADGAIIRIPVAAISALLLGTGTTITHAAVKVCAEANLVVCWVGEDNMRFYSVGTSSTHDNNNARQQAELYADINRRAEIARKMFLRRFTDIDISTRSIEDLRLLEGQRVKKMYNELGYQYGVTWKGRDFVPGSFQLSDDINKAITATNHSLYALCLSVICSMGYLPQLGFVHASGNNPFVYDIADLYKSEITLESSFRAVAMKSGDIRECALVNMKTIIEQNKLMQRIPKDIKDLLK